MVCMEGLVKKVGKAEKPRMTNWRLDTGTDTIRIPIYDYQHIAKSTFAGNQFKEPWSYLNNIYSQLIHALAATSHALRYLGILINWIF